MIARKIALTLALHLVAFSASAADCVVPQFTGWKLMEQLGSIQTMAVADFNSDGLSDSAVIMTNADAVQVMLGRPDGTLSVSSSRSIGGGGASSLIARDFNGDGEIDLAVSHVTNGLILLHGDGTGALGVPISTGISGGFELDAADFDNDGDLDFAYYTRDGVFVGRRLTDGYEALTITTSAGPAVFADVDGDGDKELAVLPKYPNQFASTINVFTLSGVPVLGQAIVVSNASWIRSRNVDADSADELMTAEWTDTPSGNATVMLNVDGGSATRTVLGPGGGAVEFADFDGDSRLDAVTSGRPVGIALQRADGTFAPPVFAPPAGEINVGDVDGDGRIDLIGRTSTALAVLGGGYEEIVNTPFTTEFGDAFLWDIEFADLDHDGDSDAVASASGLFMFNDEGWVFVRLRDGVRWKTGQRIPFFHWPERVEIADIDQDGNHDIIISGAGSVFGYARGRGDGTFDDPLVISSPFTPLYVYAADFDDDGDSDVVATNNGSGIALFRNNDGVLTVESPVAGGVASAMGDVDDDGDIDLIGIGFGTFEYVNDGNGVFTLRTTSQIVGNSIAAADMDGDRDFDIITFAHDTQRISIHERQAGMYIERLSFPAYSVYGLDAGDLNGDGLADIVYPDASGTDRTIIRLNRGGWNFGEAISRLAMYGSKVVLRETNADGRLDVVALNLNGDWSVFENRCKLITLSALSASTPASGGTRLSITGLGFLPGLTVTVAGIAAEDVALATPDSIEFTTPAGLPAGTLSDITVMNPDTSYATLARQLFVHFSDVPHADPFFPFVERIFRERITAGCGGGRFCPDQAMTRAEAAVFIEVARRGPTFVPPVATGIFLDVPTSHFAAAWIEQLSRDGITAGCGNGKFCPSGEVTRGETAVFLLLAKHGTSYSPPDATGVFNDVPFSHPFARWVEQFAREGITAGCGGGAFCLEKPTTRSQMAVFVTEAILP